MPVFIKDNKHYLFVHIPKTGGTSMEVLFSHSGWRITYIDMGNQGTLNHLRHCSPQHMHREMLQSQFVLNKFNGIFMVVRNPYDRFLSEYCWANRVNCNQSAGVDIWATKLFDAYAKNNYILDNHIRPQSEFYLPGAKVYKLEQGFANIANDLMSHYRIKLVNEDIRALSRDRISVLSSNKVELSQTVKEMINDHYYEDFQRFGYEIED